MYVCMYVYTHTNSHTHTLTNIVCRLPMTKMTTDNEPKLKAALQVLENICDACMYVCMRPVPPTTSPSSRLL